ncbi:Na+/H+ antiporter NhaC family protein [Clostridium sp. AN503]|uniref:YfcC family protein n=1 Tax=Clostridium sp. AN503 TaxID=3160598 RepID=UPI003458BBFD
MSEKAKKKFEFPDVYALLFILCIVAMALTWIIPAGSFERIQDGSLTKVVAGSFQYVDAVRQTPWDMLQAIYQGFSNSANTIFLIFFCGASVAMVEESKALSTFFTWLAKMLKGKEMIAIAILMFGLGLGNAAGAFANIGVAVMPIGIVMAQALGGDPFLGFLIVYFGLMSGFSIGFANPSILGVAQTLAEVPIFSGTMPRVICCIANITFMYCVTMMYYRKIKKNPAYSLNCQTDITSLQHINGESNIESAKLSRRQLITVVVFLAGVAICVSLTIKNSWSAKKIASYFFGMMVVTGLVSGFSMNEIAEKFIKGCKPMIYASFVTGIASAIAVILSNGKVLDTIVYALSLPLNRAGAVAGAGMMVVVNALVNMVIPSGSGQAAVMMPLMTPIADLVGITRQVAVQAFQFGDGLSNLATPLNGPLMGCLAIAGVNFPKYFKWAIKFILIEIAAAIVITMVMQSVGWIGY